MNYKKVVLDRLLDRFERSRAYLDGSSARRIMIRLCSEDMTEYDIEDTSVREAVNSTVQDLAKKGIVKFEWMRFERGNIIDRVWLCLDRVEDAYREAGRVPKRDKADWVLRRIKALRPHITQPWIEDFLKKAQEGIDARKSITPFLPGDPDMARAVLDALRAINDKGDEECLERVFSLRCFGDSKYFERNVKKRIARLIREYLVKERDSIEAPADDEMLAQVGIVRAFEQVDFCGDIQCRLWGKQVDFSAFGYGIALNSRTIGELEVTDMGTVKKVLFIENKTNYTDYILKNRKESELVIFHGGFYSPVKGEFFEKIYRAGRSAGVEFFHWGDIDIGGFRMFKRLKENIIPGLKPFLMDREAFMSKERYWLPFNKRYGDVLENMLGDGGYSEFHGVMEAMLEAKARLEQEAFL